VIVGYSDITGDAASHAFAWRGGKMIDLPETYADLARSANNIRNTIALRTSSMALMMDYDCRAFGQYNTCISFGGRYGDLNASTNEGAGILTAAYRVSPSVRIGAFIDHRVTQSKPAGINYSDDTPSIGAFVGYDDHGDGAGAQGKLTAVYNTGNVGVTRLASGANTEAGSGRSSLASYAFGAELGWGFKLNGGWVGTPYAGLKHTSSKLGAYAEQLTDSVEFPISYAAYGQRLTTATAGIRIGGRLTDRVSLALAAGIEHDLRSTMDAYAGASDIPGLASFSFSTNANSNRTRRVGSATLGYHIDSNQRVSAGAYVRENAYAAQATKSLLMQYEMAF
jgi:probable HAF family extracellular repeat protein